MRLLVLLATITLGLPANVSAEIFRCSDDAGNVGFQDTPCRAAGERVEIKVHTPSEEDRTLARIRADKTRRLVDAYEADGERARELAAAERSRKAEQRATLDARCAGYREDIAAIARSDRAGRKMTRVQEERARLARSKYFSECMGRR